MVIQVMVKIKLMFIVYVPASSIALLSLSRGRPAHGQGRPQMMEILTIHVLYVDVDIQYVTGWWFGCHCFFFPIYWVSNHPNWRTHIFQRGGPTTNQVMTSGLLCDFLCGCWFFICSYHALLHFVNQAGLNLVHDGRMIPNLHKFG